MTGNEECFDRQWEDGRLALPGSNTSQQKLPGNLLCQRGIRSREGNIYVFVFILKHRVPVQVDMDEYDELFDIQDDFEDQFADELEVLAQMEKGEDQLAKFISDLLFYRHNHYIKTLCQYP